MPVIEPLVKGAIETLIQSGVKSENIVVENVSGSFELPSACSRWVRFRKQVSKSVSSRLVFGALFCELDLINLN